VLLGSGTGMLKMGGPENGGLEYAGPTTRMENADQIIKLSRTCILTK